MGDLIDRIVFSSVVACIKNLKPEQQKEVKENLQTIDRFCSLRGGRYWRRVTTKLVNGGQGIELRYHFDDGVHCGYPIEVIRREVDEVVWEDDRDEKIAKTILSYLQ